MDALQEAQKGLAMLHEDVSGEVKNVAVQYAQAAALVSIAESLTKIAAAVNADDHLRVKALTN